MRQQQPQVRVARAQVDGFQCERSRLRQSRQIACRPRGPGEVIDRALIAAGAAQMSRDLRRMALARADERVGHPLVQQPTPRRLQRRIGGLAHQRVAVAERAVAAFEQTAGDAVGGRERRSGDGKRIELGGLYGPTGDGQQVGDAAGVGRQTAQQAADGRHERRRRSVMPTTQRSCALHGEQRVAVRRAHRPAHRLGVESAFAARTRALASWSCSGASRIRVRSAPAPRQMLLGGVERLGRDRAPGDDQQ